MLQLQGLQADFLDATSALLFEVVVLCQEVSSTFLSHIHLVKNVVTRNL